jgi:ParB family chromosome partitioning protein
MMAKRSQPGVARTDAFLYEPEALILISDAAHPLFDPRVNLPVDEAMVLNIMNEGVLEPVLFTPSDAGPVVVAGRRRVKAAIEANRRLAKLGLPTIRIPAMRKRGDNKVMLGILVSENEHRVDDDANGKAKKAQRCLDLGMTNDEICIKFGWSSPTLRSHLRLLEAAPEVRKAVAEGKLSVTASGKLPTGHAAQVKVVEKLAANGKNGKVTVKQVAKAAGRAHGNEPSRKEAKAIIAKWLYDSDERRRYFAMGLDWMMGGHSEPPGTVGRKLGESR